MHLIRLPKALEKTGLSRSRLYELLADQSFPQPVKLGVKPGARAVAWSEDEIDAWIAERLASRETASA